MDPYFDRVHRLQDARSLYMGYLAPSMVPDKLREHRTELMRLVADLEKLKSETGKALDSYSFPDAAALCKRLDTSESYIAFHRQKIQELETYLRSRQYAVHRQVESHLIRQISALNLALGVQQSLERQQAMLLWQASQHLDHAAADTILRPMQWRMLGDQSALVLMPSIEAGLWWVACGDDIQCVRESCFGPDVFFCGR